jgi:hypothetical protein
VVQGKLGIIHNGQEVVLTKESDVCVVRPGARYGRRARSERIFNILRAANRHTFFPHPSSGEDVIFDVWMTPETTKVRRLVFFAQLSSDV